MEALDNASVVVFLAYDPLIQRLELQVSIAWVSAIVMTFLPHL
jgi:hypothetical protein